MYSVRTYHHNGRVAAGREPAKVQVLGLFGPAEPAAALEQVSAGLFRARLVPANKEEVRKDQLFLNERWCDGSRRVRIAC